jgi:hypothetical protein
VKEFVGHGIGTKLHEEPQIPNYVDRKNENPRLKEAWCWLSSRWSTRRAGIEGAAGQVDRGDQGRIELGAFRALRGGDGERAVGSDRP